MLSKPHHGWTEFSIGNQEYRLSYLTDIPTDWLSQAILGMETLTPFAVHGVCEPGRLLCLVSYWNCHTIFEDEYRKELTKEEAEWDIVHLSMLDFCKNLYKDIRDNLDDWSTQWFFLVDEDTEEERQQAYDNYKNKIQLKLDRLHELIIDNEEHFGEYRCFF